MRENARRMTGATEPIKVADEVEKILTGKDVATRRKYCNWLQLWRHCAEPACHRARACAGNPAACFGQCYAVCPEAARFWVRIGLAALDDGNTARKAAMLADTVTIWCLKRDARLPLYHRKGLPLARGG